MSLLALPPELLEPIVLYSLSPGPLSRTCRALAALLAGDALRARLFLWLAWDARRGQRATSAIRELALPQAALWLAAGRPACTEAALRALDRLVANRARSKKAGRRTDHEAGIRTIRLKADDLGAAIPRWLAGSARADAPELLRHLLADRGFSASRDPLIASVKSGTLPTLLLLLEHHPTPPDVLLPLSVRAPDPVFSALLPYFCSRPVAMSAALKLAAERGDAGRVRRLLEAGAVPGGVAVLRRVREVVEGAGEAESNWKGGKRKGKDGDGAGKEASNKGRKRRKFAD
ncbi:hypothetical protein DFJ74DRAFT_702440 [Hyaloraphidium curvatum]|nr:hypothetical protein DFJ74DRAFT_702440 [Hyaloraphidium curvatum]